MKKKVELAKTKALDELVESISQFVQKSKELKADLKNEEWVKARDEILNQLSVILGENLEKCKKLSLTELGILNARINHCNDLSSQELIAFAQVNQVDLYRFEVNLDSFKVQLDLLEKKDKSGTIDPVVKNGQKILPLLDKLAKEYLKTFPNPGAEAAVPRLDKSLEEDDLQDFQIVEKSAVVDFKDLSRITLEAWRVLILSELTQPSKKATLKHSISLIKLFREIQLEKENSTNGLILNELGTTLQEYTSEVFEAAKKSTSKLKDAISGLKQGDYTDKKANAIPDLLKFIDTIDRLVSHLTENTVSKPVGTYEFTRAQQIEAAKDLKTAVEKVIDGKPVDLGFLEGKGRKTWYNIYTNNAELSELCKVNKNNIALMKSLTEDLAKENRNTQNL